MRKARRTLPIVLAASAISGLLAVTGHAGKPKPPPAPVPPNLTVKQDGTANFTSISAAYNYMVTQTGGTLDQDWTITVLDTKVYWESLLINVGTSSGARLTIRSNCPAGGPQPTIHTRRATGSEPRARPIAIGTPFVTISGFTFMKDVPNKVTDIMTSVNFEGRAPAASEVIFDNCVWDGRGLTYNGGAILFCWYPHCNITVQNSIFQNVHAGYNLSLVYLGALSEEMVYVPTFTFYNNRVIDNIDPEVQIEGNPTSGYSHRIVIQENDFTGNKGDFNLVVIRNQRAGCDIGWNEFYANTSDVNEVSRPTLALENSASYVVGSPNLIHDNYFRQNDAAAEVFVQESSSGPTVLTGNDIAASEGLAGVWADLSSTATLKSYGNTFYSQSITDMVAYWGPEDGTGDALTIDEWNAKTPEDGIDDWDSLPVP